MIQNFLPENILSVFFGASVAAVIYFIKQKDRKLESAPDKKDIELGKSETKFTMRNWVCDKIEELEKKLISMVEKLERDMEKNMEKMEQRIDKRLDEIKSSIGSYKEYKHDQAERLNIKNMENQLLIERLEKSDRIIEEGNSMIKQLSDIIYDKKA